MKTTGLGQTEELELRVLGFIRERNLLPEAPGCLLVAVSGGQDSVCLLHVLVKLQTELGVRVHAAHLDHMLRGAESASDARYVARLARKLGIPATIEKRDVKAYRTRHRLTLEEAAREVRYTFLSEVAQSLGTDRVAVAHTNDDHIETILMHLIRGSGTAGLRGLQPVSHWRSLSFPAGKGLVVVRPLLRVSREETAAYCRSHRLMVRVDVSNLSLSPLRNRIRLELLPLLQSYNPRIGDALKRTSRLAGQTLSLLDEECARLWDRIIRQQGGIFLFDRAEFLKIPAVLQRHLLRLTIEKILGNLTDIEARHIEQITAALHKTAGKRLSLPEGITFGVDYKHYWLARDPADPCPLPPLEGEIRLKMPGETVLPGWRVTATVQGTIPAEAGIQKGMELDTDLRRYGYEKTGIDSDYHAMTESNVFTAYLDFDKTGRGLVVRPRQVGDWFQPLGMDQPKKLGRFMIDARIPRSWRPRVPIIASPEQVVWVAGWRIDERAKITGTTRTVLRLEFERT